MPDPRKRVFLFLQGPTSPFMERLARELMAHGHGVERINIAFGDRLFWRLPGAVAYRGRRGEAWRDFIAGFYEQRRVTDIVLLGDCRPYHTEAIAEAQARGILVHITELGYLRPDWLTVERDGMSSFSHFPRDPDVIRKLAETAPPVAFATRYPGSFFTLSVTDIAYNVANLFLNPLFHPHYRRHAIVHPFAEYAGWVYKFFRMPWRKRELRRDLAAVGASSAPYFLFPLQLSTDYQIRAHSPFPDLDTAIAQVVRSFARYALAGTRLVIKIHPLDNALSDWRKLAARLAAEHGIADQVITLDGGDLDTLLSGAAGVVTINSTVGTSALRLGRPLLALGNAVFDVKGLTFQGPLSRFWTEAAPPDPELCDAFMRLLAATIQVRGGYYSPAGVEAGARATAERMLRPDWPLPPIAPQDRGNVRYRRAITGELNPDA